MRTGLTYLIVFCFPLISFAQVPNLDTAGIHALFTATGEVSSTAISQVIGKIGSNDGPITNFTPVIGQQENANSNTLQASIDLGLAYASILARPATFPVHAPIFGNNEILTVGAAASFENTLYLDAEGDPNAVFIFKIFGALSSAANSKISLLGGASPFNIFWAAQGGAISLATLSEMKGNFIANPGAVSAGDGCIINGRMLSTSGAISVYATNATAVPFSILSSSLKNFHANAGDNSVDLSWTSSNESSLVSYDLERSADGYLFATIGHVAATNTSSVKTYHWPDNKPSLGISFYRLKMLGKDEAFKYSAIVRIEMNSGKGMKVYPNPVSGHIMNLQIMNRSKGNYDISIYNLKSEKLVSTQVTHHGTDANYRVVLRKNIPAGTYFVKITGQQHHTETFKIIVE